MLFAVERDPSKRRVKPVEPHLLQLDFASSSDDSDFKVLTDDEDADSGCILFRLIFSSLHVLLCPAPNRRGVTLSDALV